MKTFASLCRIRNQDLCRTVSPVLGNVIHLNYGGVNVTVYLQHYIPASVSISFLAPSLCPLPKKKWSQKGCFFPSIMRGKKWLAPLRPSFRLHFGYTITDNIRIELYPRVFDYRPESAGRRWYIKAAGRKETKPARISILYPRRALCRISSTGLSDLRGRYNRDGARRWNDSSASIEAIRSSGPKSSPSAKTRVVHVAWYRVTNHEQKRNVARPRERASKTDGFLRVLR